MAKFTLPRRSRPLVLVAVAACCVAGLAPAQAQVATERGQVVTKSDPTPYSQHLLIKSWWGPGVRPSSGVPTVSVKDSRDDGFHSPWQLPQGSKIKKRGGMTVEPSDSLPDVLAADQSPPPAAPPLFPGIEGVDPMVAVGRNFVLVSQQGTVGFFDRNGNRLAVKNGVDSVVSGRELFGSFIDPEADTDINRYNGFPKPCDDRSYPNAIYGRKFCVVEVYDLRALFDPEGNRFIIYGAMRNQLWTDAFRKSFKAGEECGLYKDASGNTVPMDWSSNRGKNWCPLARRHVALAVSKTEDPRDGFHLYAVTQNNYRDFPWATINGDSLVIAHRGDEMPDGPVATVLSLSALRHGEERPPYFRYYKDDVNGYERVTLPVHHGSPSGLTLMIGGEGTDQIEVFGFPPPAAPYAKPPLSSTRVGVGSTFQAVYRNGFLHLAAHYDSGKSPNATTRCDIRVVRFPVWAESSGQGLVLKSSMSPTKGYREKSFGKNGPGDAPGDIVSYEEAALEVNKQGDMLIAYGRTPVATQRTLYPEVRYSVWYHDEATQRRSSTLKQGEGVQSESPAARMDYATAVVDPMDDETIWIAHEYGGAAGSYKLVIGRVKP